jgi:hypothetical protein
VAGATRVVTETRLAPNSMENLIGSVRRLGSRVKGWRSGKISLR